MLSVIIPTHNPNQQRLERTLLGLKQQTLSYDRWELLLVDNATPDPNYVAAFDLSWHPKAQIVHEAAIGLTCARIAGIRASQGESLVFVDDDNVLDERYLEYVVNIFASYPEMGSIGGKSIPEFEVTPAPWFAEVELGLGCRDFGETVQTFCYTAGVAKHYPKCAPVGAGMALRRGAAIAYLESLQTQERVILDRTGTNLSSGGDCDINLTILEAGWSVGYFPQLKLDHLIPAGRLTQDYLGRLNQSVMRSWVQVLDAHDIRPWTKIPAWTLPLRNLRSFLRCQAWRDPAAYIRWQGTCGLFLGRAQLSQQEK